MVIFSVSSRPQSDTISQIWRFCAVGIILEVLGLCVIMYMEKRTPVIRLMFFNISWQSKFLILTGIILPAVVVDVVFVLCFYNFSMQD